MKKITSKTTYETDDGREFKDQEAAARYKVAAARRDWRT